jgi:hypothetical protein
MNKCNNHERARSLSAALKALDLLQRVSPMPSTTARALCCSHTAWLQAVDMTFLTAEGQGPPLLILARPPLLILATGRNRATA